MRSRRCRRFRNKELTKPAAELAERRSHPVLHESQTAFRIQPQSFRQAGEIVVQRISHRLKKLIPAVSPERSVTEYPRERNVSVVALEQSDGGLKHNVALIECFRSLVHPRAGQELGDHLKPDPLLGHANPQVVIERHVDVRIESAAAVGGSPKERSRLANEAVALQDLGIE